MSSGFQWHGSKAAALLSPAKEADHCGSTAQAKYGNASQSWPLACIVATAHPRRVRVDQPRRSSRPMRTHRSAVAPRSANGREILAQVSVLNKKKHVLLTLHLLRLDLRRCCAVLLREARCIRPPLTTLVPRRGMTPAILPGLRSRDQCTRASCPWVN